MYSFHCDQNVDHFIEFSRQKSFTCYCWVFVLVKCLLEKKKTGWRGWIRCSRNICRHIHLYPAVMTRLKILLNQPKPGNINWSSYLQIFHSTISADVYVYIYIYYSLIFSHKKAVIFVWFSKFVVVICKYWSFSTSSAFASYIQYQNETKWVY